MTEPKETPKIDVHYIVTVDIKKVLKETGTLFAKGDYDIQDIAHVMLREGSLGEAVSAAISHLNILVEER